NTHTAISQTTSGVLTTSNLTVTLAGAQADLSVADNAVSVVTINGAGAASIKDVVAVTINNNSSAPVTLDSGNNDLQLGAFSSDSVLTVTAAGAVTTSVDTAIGSMTLSGITSYTQTSQITASGSVSITTDGLISITDGLSASSITLSSTDGNGTHTAITQ